MEIEKQKISFFSKYRHPIFIILSGTILAIGLITIAGKHTAKNKLTTKEYYSAQTGVAFKYPGNLTIVTEDEKGNPKLPSLFFSKSTYPNKEWSRNSCGVNDCILILGRYEEDLNSVYFGAGFKGKFPVYQSDYIHKDENDSKNYQINGLIAKRFYIVGWHGGSYLVPKGYRLLEERVYIRDPYTAGRIIEVRYGEFTDKEIPDPSTMKPDEIRASFNQKKYTQYQQVISSVSIPKYDVKSTTTHKSSLLGIEFSYPSVWGKITEQIYKNDFSSGIEKMNLFFDSLLYSYNDPNPISVRVHNDKTVYSYYEGLGHTVEYGGEDIQNICNTKSYINPHDVYTTVLESSCKVENINGVPVALVDVVTVAFEEMYGGRIPEKNRIAVRKKALLLQSKSLTWPGITFEIRTVKEKFTEEEKKMFQDVVRSIKYSDNPTK